MAPTSGVWPVRFRWSRISTGVPGAQSGFSPPQPLVSTRSWAPAAAAVRTPWTTAATPRPSYRWVRPVKIAAVLRFGVRTTPEQAAVSRRRSAGRIRAAPPAGPRRAAPRAPRRPPTSRSRARRPGRPRRCRTAVGARGRGPARSRGSSITLCTLMSIRSPAAGARPAAKFGDIVLAGLRPPRPRRPGCRGCGHSGCRPRSRSTRTPTPSASPSRVTTRTRTLRYSPESALSHSSSDVSSALGHVVQGDEHLMARLLREGRQRAVPAVAAEGDPPAHQPAGSAQRRVRTPLGHLPGVEVAPVRRVQHGGEAIEDRPGQWEWKNAQGDPRSDHRWWPRWLRGRPGRRSTRRRGHPHRLRRSGRLGGPHRLRSVEDPDRHRRGDDRGRGVRRTRTATGRRRSPASRWIWRR